MTDSLDDLMFLDGGGAESPGRPRRRSLWRWIAALGLMLLAGAAGVVWIEWQRAKRIDALILELKESNATVGVTRGGPAWLNQNWPGRPWLRAFDRVDSVDVSVHDDPPFDTLVDRLAECGRIDQLNMSYRQTENDHLRGLATLDLRELSLQFTPVDDAGLTHLRGMPGLRVLRLEGSPVTDVGLAEIGGLSGLRALDLRQTQVTDGGLEALAGLSSLESLWLSKTAVRGAGLTFLVPLRSLKFLALGETHAEDWELDRLAALSTVTTLTIYGNGITDAHLPAIAAMPALETLSLSATGVTDRGLAHLHERRQLKQIELFGTRCTRRGVRALQEALPGAVIESRFSE